ASATPSTPARGSSKLMVVAGLTLSVVLTSDKRARVSARRQRLARDLLLGALCMLTLVVLASALRRIGLSEDAFGFTRARVSAEAIVLWLGVVIVLVLALGAAGRRALVVRAATLASGVALLAFSLANPDGRVGAANVDRFERTGKIDLGYLRGLSADAVPAIERLPAGERGAARPDVKGSGGLFGFNLARAQGD
ncbi:MAG: DUF4173 domain-containing protein, partial [Thermoleophilaceae bacterium]|nr:DUF4173 domain-containing protein [Thermoleophilaceae bacterium]